jgi:hypothetical protein
VPKQFSGVVNVDIRDSVPDWEPFLQPKAPEGAPNVLMIVWDDVGYGAMDVFGGPIATPTMQRIADAGLRYSNFHTTALCSPTRSSVLTGRNATSNNMACITEGSAGFPGSPRGSRSRTERSPRSSTSTAGTRTQSESGT